MARKKRSEGEVATVPWALGFVRYYVRMAVADAEAGRPHQAASCETLAAVYLRSAVNLATMRGHERRERAAKKGSVGA